MLNINNKYQENIINSHVKDLSDHRQKSDYR